MILPEWLQEPGGVDTAVPFRVLATRLVVAFLLGCVVAAIHHVASGRRGAAADRPFQATLILLCLLIALVTVVIGNSVARAFSLVGALAIVRFRTVVEDTRDTAFVIFAVAAGMSAGVDYPEAPLVCAPFVLLTAWLLAPKAAGRGPAEGRLIVRLGAGRIPDEKLHALIQEHLGAHRLIGLSTARGGAAVDASYAVRLPPADKVFALLTELGRVDGVQNVELKED